MLPRPDQGDFAGDEVPEPTRPQRDETLAAEKPTARRVFLDRQDDQFEQAAGNPLRRFILNRFVVFRPSSFFLPVTLIPSRFGAL